MNIQPAGKKPHSMMKRGRGQAVSNIRLELAAATLHIYTPTPHTSLVY